MVMQNAERMPMQTGVSIQSHTQSHTGKKWKIKPLIIALEIIGLYPTTHSRSQIKWPALFTAFITVCWKTENSGVILIVGFFKKRSR